LKEKHISNGLVTVLISISMASESSVYHF